MIVLVTIVLWVASTVGAVAQSVSAGSVVETYTMRNADELRVESIRLLTLPFAAEMTVGDAVLGVRGAYADAEITVPTGERLGAAGMTDTRASVNFLFGYLVLGAAAVLGTGDVVSTDEQAVLVGFLSTDLLPFATRQWGTGGGFTADAAYRLVLGETRLTLGVGASTTSATESLSPGLVYSPGRQIRGRAAIEAPIGAAGVLSVGFGLQRFSTDTYDGRNLFSPGQRWEGFASYAFALGPRESVLVFGSIADIEGGVSEIAAGTVEFPGFMGAVGDRPARKTLRAGVEMRLERGRATFVPRSEWRALRRDDGIGQGWLGTAGAGAEVTLLRRGYHRSLIAEPTLDVSFGTLEAAAGRRSGVFGWRLGAAFRWSRAP